MASAAPTTTTYRQLPAARRATAFFLMALSAAWILPATAFCGWPCRAGGGASGLGVRSGIVSALPSCAGLGEWQRGCTPPTVDNSVAHSSARRRKAILGLLTAIPLVWTTRQPDNRALAATGPEDGNLADLPPDAVRSYLQYRMPLQTSVDFYVFELQDLIADTNEWGQVGQLFQANNNRGQGIPNRMEREFTNVMRILGLSMPPDTADEMREAQFRFEKALASISKVTEGIRRDLPVEIDRNAPAVAMQGWEDGRRALNDFLVALNTATGLSEMKTIPAAGPRQLEEYGRSGRRYVELKKKIKLCQNRGGPTLSQAWGQLMVSGYLQDSCGIPDIDGYFYQ